MNGRGVPLGNIGDLGKVSPNGENTSRRKGGFCDEKEVDLGGVKAYNVLVWCSKSGFLKVK